MARKNNVKTEHPSSILFDSRTGTVMAGPDSNDNIKEKVQSVREVVLGKSNNEIVLVLQYYDYNVEKAIQAYLEDDAKEALGEWHVPPAKPNKKKKNKKKAANAGQTDNGPSASIGGAASPAASLSSSLSSQPSLSSAQPLPQRVPAVSNGISSSGSSVTETNNNNSSSASKPLLSNGMVCSGSIKDVEVSGLPAEDGTVTAATAAAAEVSVTTSSSHPPASASATKQHNHRVSAGSHGHGHGHGHAHGHNQRTRTTSERSTASGVGAGGDNHPKRPFQGLEKSIKDLQRQTTSLEHLRLVLDHEIERSYKSIKMVFEEMRTHLNTREKEIVSELDVVKQQAYEVFKMRQEKAATLKVHIERAEKMSESELGDLRADVKHFVADRKIDEELGKTTRFQYDSDHLKEEILSFGEVVPVKSNYVHRRPSVSSVASSGPGVEEVPPSSAASLHSDPAPVASLRAASSLERENAQMTTEELADLQIRLQNSLKLQGLVEDRRPSNGNDSSPSTKDDSQQTKSARRRNRNREREEQRRHEEEVMVTSSPPGEASSRAATPSSTHASAGSASPSPQRGQRSSPHRGGGYRGRGRGGNYRGGQQQQGRGSPRRPYSANRGGGRGGGGDYGRQGGSRSVVVNGGYS